MLPQFAFYYQFFNCHYVPNDKLCNSFLYMLENIFLNHLKIQRNLKYYSTLYYINVQYSTGPSCSLTEKMFLVDINIYFCST